jgi:hypothetical protein
MALPARSRRVGPPLGGLVPLGRGACRLCRVRRRRRGEGGKTRGGLLGMCYPLAPSPSAAPGLLPGKLQRGHGGTPAPSPCRHGRPTRQNTDGAQPAGLPGKLGYSRASQPAGTDTGGLPAPRPCRHGRPTRQTAQHRRHTGGKSLPARPAYPAKHRRRTRHAPTTYPAGRPTWAYPASLPGKPPTVTAHSTRSPADRAGLPGTATRHALRTHPAHTGTLLHQVPS